VNNDAIPAQNSLKDFVEIMVSYPKVGEAQGILLRDEKTIDTAGDFASKNSNNIPAIKREISRHANSKETIYSNVC